MSINNTVVKDFIATVFMNNGQTVEIDVRGRTISGVREYLKRVEGVAKILKIKKA